MEDLANPLDNVSPITDLSRNLTSLQTLGGESLLTTPQMPPAKLSMVDTPDSTSSFRLKPLTPLSEYSSESEAEPSPIAVNLHRRALMSQATKASLHESPFQISRAGPRRTLKRSSQELLKDHDEPHHPQQQQQQQQQQSQQQLAAPQQHHQHVTCSPFRKNSSQGYCSSTSDGFALDEILLDDEDNSNNNGNNNDDDDDDNNDDTSSSGVGSGDGGGGGGGGGNKENHGPLIATNSIASLLSAPISNQPPPRTSSAGALLCKKGPTSARRNLSFTGGASSETPIKSKRGLDEERSSKRSRTSRCLVERPTNVIAKLPRFYSESNIDREAAEDVIDKGSIATTLPTSGAHKSCAIPTITATTMNDILNGKYDHVVSSFQIVDCRWPYEYDGGHIRGALNLYTYELVFGQFLEKTPEDVEADRNSGKKDIVIFHCEFSSERGPKMSQYLREKDREVNVYPKLFYPEVYILQGGYKDFFQKYKEHCFPQEYLKMVDERFTKQCRLYRSQSKTFEKKGLARNQSSRF